MNKSVLRRNERIYAFILNFYPKSYMQEFGGEMKYVFSESLKDAYTKKGQRGIGSLWVRTLIDAGKSVIKEHLENLKGGETMKTKKKDLIMQNKIFLWIAIGTGLILLIPMVLTLLNPTSSINGGKGGGWDWSFGDLPFAFILFFGTGSTFVLLARKARTVAYRVAVGVALAATFLLIWINGAVGIIGEDEGTNLIYFAALFVGFVTSLISRFEPKGMARAMFVTAFALALVPVVALVIKPEQVIGEPPGIVGVFMINTVFVIAYVVSGVIFRRTASKYK